MLMQEPRTPKNSNRSDVASQLIPLLLPQPERNDVRRPAAHQAQLGRSSTPLPRHLSVIFRFDGAHCPNRLPRDLTSATSRSDQSGGSVGKDIESI
jgi:hypothetical protein